MTIKIHPMVNLIMPLDELADSLSYDINFIKIGHIVLELQSFEYWWPRPFFTKREKFGGA